MAFIRGQVSNPKGRAKGSKNKLTILAAKEMEGCGFDPLDFLVKIASDETQPIEVRLRAAITLMPYRYKMMR